MFGYLYSTESSSDKKEFPQTSRYPYKHKFDHGIVANKASTVCIGDLEVTIKGRIFKSFNGSIDAGSSDEEVCAKLYKKEGIDFYKQLDGHFLILIYDKKNGLFSIFNNRYQATTLYYYQFENGNFIFSDQISEILSDSEFEAKIDFGSVRSFVSNGFTITDQTQILGVKKLLPSFRLTFKNGSIEYGNHWHEEFDFERTEFSDLEAHLDQYESLYRDSIEGYLAKHPTTELGTLLSGGHDTSFTMIQSSKIFDKSVHAFTSTFPGWCFDEGDYAENICNKYGGIHHRVPFVPEDLDYIVGLIRANDEPVVGSSLPLHRVAQESKKYVDTMLAGDGGDTLWAEYYPVAEIHKYMKHMPRPFRRAINSVAQGLSKGLDWERLWELAHVTSLFKEDDYYDGFMRKLCTYRHFTDEFQNDLFTPEFLNGSSISRSILEVPFNKNNFANSLIEGKLFNAFYTYQSFHTTKSMEHFNLNFHMPTINRDIMQFITRLPEKYVNGGNTFHRMTNSKVINRKFHKLALARYLDRDEIYNRSFDIPWYSILKPRTEVLRLLRKRLKARGWYRENTIDQIFSEFENHKVKNHELLELKHHGYRIFTLLSLEIWTTEYIDGRMTQNFDCKIPLEDYLGS